MFFEHSKVLLNVNVSHHQPQPGITFAIPYYKGLDYLNRAIVSVFRQESPDWRLVICDDSPAGEGEAVLSSFRDDRVSYSRNPRTLGMALNWNRCLDVARTGLVTLLHADDELLPSYAGLMLKAGERYPETAAFFCRARVIGPDSQARFSFPDRIKDVLMPWGNEPIQVAGSQGLAGLLRGNYIMCPTVCYRKAAIGSRRFSERWKFVLDLDFFSRLLRDGETLTGIPAFGYAYRRHAENATAAYTENLLRFEEEAALYDELAADARHRGWSDVERVGRRKRIIRLHLAFRICADVLRGRFRPALKKLDFLHRLGRRTPTPTVQVQPCETSL